MFKVSKVPAIILSVLLFLGLALIMSFLASLINFHFANNPIRIILLFICLFITTSFYDAIKKQEDYGLTPEENAMLDEILK